MVKLNWRRLVDAPPWMQRLGIKRFPPEWGVVHWMVNAAILVGGLLAETADHQPGLPMLLIHSLLQSIGRR